MDNEHYTLTIPLAEGQTGVILNPGTSFEYNSLVAEKLARGMKAVAKASFAARAHRQAACPRYGCHCEGRETLPVLWRSSRPGTSSNACEDGTGRTEARYQAGEDERTGWSLRL